MQIHTLEELQGLVVIDRNHLDEELIKQSQLFWEAGEGFAQAVSKQDQAKQVLEQVAATTASSYRSNSIEKITEAKITEHVDSHPDYIQQYRLYLTYKGEADRWMAIKNAYAHRNEMLRSLVSLVNIGYWNSSSVSDEQIQSYKNSYRNKGNQ
jgi:hypothetical protein